MKKGKFIVLESGEGAGKTTMLRRAKRHFGKQIHVTREPGGSKYSERIRHLILKSPHAKLANANTMFALFWASRADHVEKTVSPRLEAGQTVISDRFDLSTYAYQIVAQGGKYLEPLFWMIRKLFLGKTIPDLYIYLDVDPVIGLARKSGQGPSELNHFEARKVDFHRRQRLGAKKFMKHVRHVVVDASQSVDEVWAEVKAILEREISR